MKATLLTLAMLACAGVALSQQTQSSTEANVSKSGDPDANTAVPRGNPEIINQKLPEDFPVLSFNAENPIDNFFEYIKDKSLWYQNNPSYLTNRIGLTRVAKDYVDNLPMEMQEFIEAHANEFEIIGQ